MRVLHVVPSFYPAVCYGGPIYSVLNLCLNLKKLGCDLTVLTTDANGGARLTTCQKNDALLDSMHVRYCRRVGRGMIAPQLARHVFQEAERADVIHLTAVYNFATLPTLLSARSARKPLVWSPRGTLQRWSGSRRTGAKATWERLCRLIQPSRLVLHVTSEQEAAESAPRLGHPAVRVIPNGIEIPPLPPPPAVDGVLKLLFIGRLDPKKGLENLLAWATMFGCLLGKWRLRIAGDGDPAYVAQLRRQCSPAGEHVEFLGHLDGEKKLQAFAECDFVIVPSHTENFGLVVAEALAHARPVIASRGTPWSEVERHGCGLWVDNDPASLAQAVQKLHQSDSIAMGRRGREWMIRDFSWMERARNMLSLYQELVRS